MTVQAREFVRLCPQCEGERPASELICENVHNGGPCRWSLADEEVRLAGSVSAMPAGPPSVEEPGRRCVNGHDVDPGDQLCLLCGRDVIDGDGTATAPPNGEPDTCPDSAPEISIDGWRAVERLPPALADEPWERFLVASGDDGRQALLTLYHPGSEPDPAVHEVLRRTPLEHVQ